MTHLDRYNSVEEMFTNFLEFLPKPQSNSIASVFKHARIDGQAVLLKAKKEKIDTGFIWNFQITLTCLIEDCHFLNFANNSITILYLL